MIYFVLGAASMLFLIWTCWVTIMVLKVRKSILGLTTAIEILATPEDNEETSEPIGFHLT